MLPDSLSFRGNDIEARSLHRRVRLPRRRQWQRRHPDNSLSGFFGADPGRERVELAELTLNAFDPEVTRGFKAECQDPW